ncbi:TlpA family protein disulfide reductase [Variovorax sp. HJSM1_2]|uniref:TlpA family protein disulfide reductase n=1 Tax=Variovorax sp. HJSM1_2 TaxID=3366263 RepID=UPI003BE7C1A4
MNAHPSPIEANPAPSRRGLLLAAAGIAAAAGAGLAWWQAQPPEGSGDPLSDALWSLSFDTPGGQKLVLADFKGKPLLVNFWATWCAPCVEELPLLDRFFKQNAANSWIVVGLAIDQPSAVQKFLQKLPVTFPIGLAGLGGTDLVKTLGNTSGGLPFTVVLGAEGKVLHRKMGQVTPADLELWVRQT